jgi:hypothetical protein
METVMDISSTNGLIDPTYEIDSVDDPQEAIRRAGAQERVILAEAGRPPVAVIPLIDLKLLLRLEDEELDRIDVRELRAEEQAADNQDLIPWAEVKQRRVHRERDAVFAQATPTGVPGAPEPASLDQAACRGRVGRA